MRLFKNNNNKSPLFFGGFVFLGLVIVKSIGAIIFNNNDFPRVFVEAFASAILAAGLWYFLKKKA